MIRDYLDATRPEHQSNMHHFVAAYTRAVTSFPSFPRLWTRPDLTAIAARFFQPSALVSDGLVPAAPDTHPWTPDSSTWTVRKPRHLLNRAVGGRPLGNRRPSVAMACRDHTLRAERTATTHETSRLCLTTAHPWCSGSSFALPTGPGPALLHALPSPQPGSCLRKPRFGLRIHSGLGTTSTHRDTQRPLTIVENRPFAHL